MSETQKSLSEHQELTQEAQQHLVNLEALVQFRELHPGIFATIAPKVKAVLTEGDNPIVPVFSEEEIKLKIITEPRRYKYTNENMLPLRQELENIKLGFISIEKYDSKNHGNPIDYFINNYGKYLSPCVIYRRDLWEIDNRLLTQIQNCFYKPPKHRYNDKKDTRGYKNMAELLPNREDEINSLRDVFT